MNATLSIDLELITPTTVSSALELLGLHPSQINWIRIQLRPIQDTTGEKLSFMAQVENSRMATYNLVALAQETQPEGTLVTVWFQGRSESFEI